MHPPSSREGDPMLRKCFDCGETGHMRTTCTNQRKKRTKRKPFAAIRNTVGERGEWVSEVGRQTGCNNRHHLSISPDSSTRRLASSLL